MKKGLIAAALIILGSAFAAAMATTARADEPASAPTWNGLYFGVNGGGVWGRTTNPTVQDVGPDTFFAGANVPAVTAGASRGFGNSGGLAGVQVGYLFYQPGSPVFGVELAADWMGLSGSTSSGPTVYPVTPPSTFTWSLKAKSSFLATLLGRIGYNMGSWYPYATAGLAVATLKYSATYRENFYPSVSTVSLSQTEPGVALGGGVEWRLADHWLLRGEYLYMMFDTVQGNGQISCTPGVGACVGAGFSTTFSYKTNFAENVGRLALSYQW